MPDDTPVHPDDGLFVRLPYAVMLAVEADKISYGAGYVYYLMLSRYNEQRGDANVWPSREWLAQKMCVKQPRTIDRFIAELENAGFLLKVKQRTSGGMRARNIYTLLVLPPRSAEKRTTERPAETQETPGGGVVRSTALRSAEKRTSVVRSTAPRKVRPTALELEEVELDQEELDQSSSSPRLDRTVAGIAARGLVDDDDEALRIIKQIETDHPDPIPMIDRFVARFTDEDLTRVRDRIRVDHTAPPALPSGPGYATTAQAPKLPPCRHSNPGGDYINPTNGVHHCPECRRAKAAGFEVPTPKVLASTVRTGPYRNPTEPVRDEDWLTGL